jgi:hypothetical protein
VRTNRILASLAALLVVASGFALLTTAPSNAAAGRAAQLPAKPRVGQCRTTTFAQSFNMADSHKPVPCSKAHTMHTFAVPNVPKRLAYKNIGAAKLEQVAVTACTRPFWKALGGSFATRDETAYTWVYFAPTKAQRKAGARWLRCDVILPMTLPGATSSQLAPLSNLPFPVIGNRSITDAIRSCLTAVNHGYVTTCDHPHAARSDRTFTIASATKPSQATVNAAAATKCPAEHAIAPYYRYWDFGDHTIVCYSTTTS